VVLGDEGGVAAKPLVRDALLRHLLADLARRARRMRVMVRDRVRRITHVTRDDLCVRWIVPQGKGHLGTG